MARYKIITDDAGRRSQVADWLSGLDRVSSEVRERIITAWVTTWSASDYASLEAMPYSASAPKYPLKQHVNDVIRVGQDLAERARLDWGVAFDAERLYTILALHDVDKPLMFTRANGEVAYTPLYHQIPHGVLGAMLLKDLDFDDVVVSTVTLHSPIMPFHGKTFEGYILHYADMFSTDKAYSDAGMLPFYQRKHQ